MKNVIFWPNLHLLAMTVILLNALWCVLQCRGSDRLELLTSHRSLLCLQFGIIFHMESLITLWIGCRIAEGVLHGVIEIWAYPSFIRFDEVVRVSWRLFLGNHLYRLILPISVITHHSMLIGLGLVLLVLFSSFILIHKIIWWPRILANGSRSFLNLGADHIFSLALRFFIVTTNFSIKIRLS